MLKELILLLALLMGDHRWTVNEFAKYYNVSPGLAACIVSHESRWDPELVSAAGDTGLFQIIPSTAAWVATKLEYTEYDMKNPLHNIDFGMYILKYYPEWYSTLYLCEED